MWFRRLYVADERNQANIQWLQSTQCSKRPSWFKWFFLLFFWRCLVWISVRTLIILTDLRSFPRSSHVNVGIVPQIRPQTPSFYIISISLFSVIQSFGAVRSELVTATLNEWIREITRTTRQCQKSLEPMGILFIIYIICFICSPRHSSHFLSRFTMFVRVLLNILWSRVAQHSVILCLRWRRSQILTAYTIPNDLWEALSPPFHPVLMPFLAF
jgi:hypothetical protein